MVLDVVGALAAEDGDGVLFRGEAAGGVEGGPGALLEVLGGAEGDLSGGPLRGAIATTGPGARDRELDEAEGASEGRVGGEAGSEAAAPGVDAKLVRDRAADEQEERDRVGRRVDAGEVELRVGDGAHGGDEQGHVLGEAAGHDGVHGDGVDGGLATPRRQDADDLKGVAGGYRRAARRRAPRSGG